MCNFLFCLFKNVYIARRFDLASFTEIQMASNYNVQLLDFHSHFLRAVTAVWLQVNTDINVGQDLQCWRLHDNLRQDLLGTNHEVKLKMVMWWSLELFFSPGMRNSAARWSWWWLACVACMGSLRIKVEFEKARLSMEAESRGSLVSGFQASWISRMIICTTPHHISGLRCWSSKLLIGVSLS